MKEIQQFFTQLPSFIINMSPHFTGIGVSDDSGSGIIDHSQKLTIKGCSFNLIK